MTGSAESSRNRLAAETSPYLLQHADNPVHWYPWGDEALADARARDCPILLSIGYSACHWCHVMAHESFADEATAGVMNSLFVNVKVDREERPDIDKVYQLAHQVLTRNTGGWPLTVFLDPHTQLPFFAGTYFPAKAAYQMPAFTDLMARVADVWSSKRDELSSQNEQLRGIFSQVDPDGEGTDLPGPDILDAARNALAENFDHQHGGFGSAPKFPMTGMVERLMRHRATCKRNGNDDGEALDMAMRSLTAMARGGIHDHLGGGFSRYTVDAEWLVPHFEKMLYDNAALLTLYADALRLGPDPLFREAATGIARWAIREMQQPEGGFSAALDADSEGEEGKFYVWRKDRVKRCLEPDEYLLVETLYGLDKPANFEGHWILRRRDSWRSVVQRLSLEPKAAAATLASAKTKLLAERSTRVPPGRDHKVLAAWNGLMVQGLARAGVVLDEPSWIDAACTAMDFIREHMWQDADAPDNPTPGHSGQGRLLATWADGRARFNGYLDDYAGVLTGLTELLQVRWREQDAAFAVALANAVVQDFADPEQGGFFFTRHDHEQLIHRPKPTLDDALPGGNGQVACALLKLGHLFGNTKWLDTAHQTLVWAAPFIQRYPAGHGALLSALEDLLQLPELVLIYGPGDEARQWQQALPDQFQPWRSTFVIATDGPTGPGTTLPPYLPRMEAASARNSTRAWVCRDGSCSLPITSLDALLKAVD